MRPRIRLGRWLDQVEIRAPLLVVVAVGFLAFSGAVIGLLFWLRLLGVVP